MSTKNFLTTIACTCLLLLSCNSVPPVDTKAEAETLQNLSNEWCAAIAVGDVEKIMSFFVPESVEMDQDNPIIIGIPDIKKAQESWLSDTLVRSTFKFSFEKIEISSSGDLAWYRGKGSFSMNTENGPVKIVEKSINIWKKIDGQWKVIVMISNTDKPEEPVSTTATQQKTITEKLDQAVLIKQYLGSWKGVNAKDTIEFYEARTYGTGVEGYFKYVTEGKIVMEGKQLWGYDKNTDRFIFTNVIKGNDVEIYAFWFISKNKYLCVPLNESSDPEKAPFKIEGEIKSEDILMETSIDKNKPGKPRTYKRIH